MKKTYYTYAYLREDRTPYYVGKGKGTRAYRKNRVGVKPPKNRSRILILKKDITEEEAFKHEIYMISVFGRKDLGTGILHNKTNGGEGSSNVNEKIKRLHSDRMKKLNENKNQKGQSIIAKNAGIKAAKLNKENNIGFWNSSLQSDLGKRGARKTNQQKWKCLETGFMANPGNLTQYQRARGIDVSKREKIT
jgi:hypothetical protein